MKKDPVAVAFNALVNDLPSADSRRAYKADWARYVLWLGLEDVSVTEARPRHVSGHIAHLRDRGMAKSTLSRALSVIREVYGALVRDEVIETNPAREVKQLKMDSDPKTPHLSNEEHVEKVLNVVVDEGDMWRSRRNQLCVQLLLGLGWRRREIAALSVESFADDFTTATGKVKGSKNLTAGVPAWLAENVRQWLLYAGIEEGALLPRSSDNSRPISGDIIYQIVKEACAKAGVPQVSPHGLRRTKITVEGAHGVSLKERQLAVGHASQATTERYDRARDAAKNAPGQVFANMIKKEKST
jgi:site-specific recombinase XerD